MPHIHTPPSVAPSPARSQRRTWFGKTWNVHCRCVSQCFGPLPKVLPFLLAPALKVGRLEGSSIKLPLVLQGSLHRAHYQSLMIGLLRVNLRLRRASRRILRCRVFFPCVSFKHPRRQSRDVETSRRDDPKCVFYRRGQRWQGFE